MKINEEIKAKWVAALRSGEYKQGRGSLRKVDSKGVDRFCCLGVLCDIYTKEKETTKWIEPGRWVVENEYSFGGDTTMPPKNVNEWVGLGDTTPWSDMQIKASSKYGTLYELNDSGSPFKKIADYIEAQL